MSKTINRYLNLCLKCSACSNFCPSNINIVDIVALAKAEYFNNSLKEKFFSKLKKFFIFNIFFNLFNIFRKKTKSRKFNKKVVYFGGCKGKLSGNDAVVKILNSAEIEVISPNFNCCGIPFFVQGDMETFYKYMEDFYKKIKNYGITDIVTTCASCEKALKSYKEWGGDSNINVKNIFEYIRESDIKLKLKSMQTVTFHKPCNINNFEDILWIFNNTENLNYIEATDYDKCCGLNGICNFKEYKTMIKIFKEKRNSLIKTGVKTVLTSCLGCEQALKLFSFGKYKVEDFTEFLAKNLFFY